MNDQDDQYAADDEELGELEEGGGVIEGGCIAIPDGEYELRYVFYETGMFFGSPKVAVHFTIVAPDEHASVPVCRYYNVKELIGPYRKYGGYIATPRGSLKREYGRLVREPKRPDRISFSVLKGRRILARLATVMRAHDRADLAPDDQYSKVAELLRIIDDDFGL